MKDTAKGTAGPYYYVLGPVKPLHILGAGVDVRKISPCWSVMTYHVRSDGVRVPAPHVIYDLVTYTFNTSINLLEPA